MKTKEQQYDKHVFRRNWCQDQTWSMARIKFTEKAP